MVDYWKYKRGSEWRKWDLHIHTPNTKLVLPLFVWVLVYLQKKLPRYARKFF